MKKPNKNIFNNKNNTVRYRLGNMDYYSIAVWKTPLENCSFYECFFDETIQGDKLIESVKKAIEYFPLFKTKIIFDKEYLLEENFNDVSKTIKHIKIDDRPKIFGSIETTNEFPFQISYFENQLAFEWCHASSDGRGAIYFLSKILDAYFDLDLGPLSNGYTLDLPYESFYDKTVKPFGLIKQESGFAPSSLKIVKNGYKCRSTILKIPASDVLSLSKRADATPVAILTPLLCKAIREHIPEKVKNRNVSCGIVVDGRKGLELTSMHNCIFNKVITYTDKMDQLDIQTQGTIYRSILDLFCQKENLIYSATQSIDSTDFLYRLRPRFLQRGIMKIVAPIIKTHMNNIAFTYIGKVPFSDAVKSHMNDFRFVSWPDIGGCVCAMADLNGTLILDITDNYKDKGIVDSFVKICESNNIRVAKEQPTVFEQANMRIK